MITGIEIKKFQCHKETYIEFSPKVNVIKGESRSGKSAIMRAFKWAFFNRPTGEGFKSSFANKKDDIEVSVFFDDDQYITRRKGKQNQYLTGDLELSAVGFDVPDEIKAITKIKEINFQGQHDKYFLLGETAGFVGKTLSEFVGLGIIDEKTKIINKIINETNMRSKINEEDLKKAEEKLLSFSHLNEIEIVIGTINSLLKEQTQSAKRIYQLKNILFNIQKEKQTIEESKKFLEIRPKYQNLMARISRWKKLEKKRNDINLILRNLEIHRERIESAEKILTIKPMCQDLKSLMDKFAIQLSALNKINSIRSAIKTAKSQRTEALHTRSLLLKRKEELSTALDFCQYCGAEKKHWRK